jgi:hypothetical protein
MSATVDITKYKEYFREIGRGERVQVIAIPCSPHTSIFQRKVLYLEQVIIVITDYFKIAQIIFVPYGLKLIMN